MVKLCLGLVLPKKHDVDVKAGTIDHDYTGNVLVLLESHGTKLFQIQIGDRIAQIVLLQIQTPKVISTASNY
jgi:dUTP pyrophosphatase